MNVRRSIREYFHPELKEKRLLDTDIREFQDDIQEKMRTHKLPPQELQNIYTMILEKEKNIPIGDQWLESLRYIRGEINQEIEICFLDFLKKYIERVIVKDQKAKNYLLSANTILTKYATNIQPETIKLIESMKYLEEYTHINDLKETSETLKKFYYEIVYKKDFDFLKYLQDSGKSFHELSELTNYSLEYFRKQTEYLKKLTEITEEAKNILYNLTHAINIERFRDRDELINQFESLRNSVDDQLRYAQNILPLKEQLHEHVLMLDNGYNLLLNTLGEEFAVHGTGAILHHVTEGIPTGGQGGANFMLRFALTVFAKKGFLVTKFKYLLKEAYRQGAIIRISIGEAKLQFLLNGNTIIKISQSSIQDLNSIQALLVKGSNNVLLQIEKDNNTMLKVPFVVITEDADIYNDQEIIATAKKVFSTQDKEFQNQFSLEQLTLYLIRDKNGREILNKYL